MSLREQLLARQLPKATVTLRMDWSTEVDQAERELESARQTLQRSGEPDSDTEGRVAELETRVGEAYYQVQLKTIPPADMEALWAAHRPSEEEQKNGAQWAPTFGPAVLAATVVDSGLTEADWAALMTGDQLTSGEISVLVQTALMINNRAPDITVGKGSAPTIS